MLHVQGGYPPFHKGYPSFHGDFPRFSEVIFQKVVEAITDSDRDAFASENISSPICIFKLKNTEFLHMHRTELNHKNPKDMSILKS